MRFHDVIIGINSNEYSVTIPPCVPFIEDLILNFHCKGSTLEITGGFTANDTSGNFTLQGSLDNINFIDAYSFTGPTTGQVIISFLAEAPPVETNVFIRVTDGVIYSAVSPYLVPKCASSVVCYFVSNKDKIKRTVYYIKNDVTTSVDIDGFKQVAICSTIKPYTTSGDPNLINIEATKEDCDKNECSIPDCLCFEASTKIDTTVTFINCYGQKNDVYVTSKDIARFCGRSVLNPGMANVVTLSACIDTESCGVSPVTPNIVLEMIQKCTGENLSIDFIFTLSNFIDRKSTRLNSSHVSESRMPSSA